MKKLRWILWLIIVPLALSNASMLTSRAWMAKPSGIQTDPTPTARDQVTLRSLVVNSLTDKDTIHSYLDVYQELFGSKNVQHILEIGVDKGGSIKLWHDYFPAATVYGIDIVDYIAEEAQIKDNDRVVLLFHDAYDGDFVRTQFQGIKLDVAIDDGPHGLDSMQSMIRLYLPLMADDGILIIEDVQTPEWFPELEGVVPPGDLQHVRKIDLRARKGQYDDLLFVIDRSR